MKNVVALVRELAEPKIRERNLELWDAEFKKEGADYYLRLYINRPDGNVGIEDCEALDRYLGPLLDEADPIPQSYCLEVTSPGADRELTRPAHFAYYEGWPVNVKLYRPDETGRREIAGILKEATDRELTLTTEEGQTRTFTKKDIAAVHAIDLWEDEDAEAEQTDT